MSIFGGRGGGDNGNILTANNVVFSKKQFLNRPQWLGRW